MRQDVFKEGLDGGGKTIGRSRGSPSPWDDGLDESLFSREVPMSTAGRAHRTTSSRGIRPTASRCQPLTSSGWRAKDSCKSRMFFGSGSANVKQRDWGLEAIFIQFRT